MFTLYRSYRVFLKCVLFRMNEFQRCVVTCYRLDMEPTPENHILLDIVKGVFDSSGGILSSESTGVSIYLPPNAIPNGVNQQIYFKVGTV